MLRSIPFRHSSLLKSVYANGRTLSTLPASSSLGCLPTTHSPVVSKLAFFNSVTGDGSKIPSYRVLDALGTPIEGAEVPEISEQFARRLYENMQLLPTIDDILCSGQRQGRIPFYATSYGEEAAVIGSAAALADDDEVLSQYRETGVLLWRGFHLDGIMAQVYGNHEDSGKGRQIAVHYGSKEHHFHTISSPLATQIPQAAGVGFALKRDPARRSKNVACVFFGEGAASEGDFHAGMLFASTVPSPTLFLARNNGFAISTPNSQQFYGDGISARGPGYGVDTVRVDGNDVLAVLSAVKEARRRCLEGGRAVLVEMMTYRIGHHSTSDDSYVYRERQEVEDRKKNDNPITRFRLFMESRGWWNDMDEQELVFRLRRDVIKAFKRAEPVKKPELKDLFADVYAEEPWNIREQREELAALLKKYGQVWEPWRSELRTLKDGGKELSD
ncbi:thiamine diphosphate-binding protein [Suillus clintonianus]|uniref:thiamine diphosphate-binding protein n=1 Tax=Suillus clintonianus TaxID=1904413 RepID=UPI001B8857F4|nr:thiamine diphosphate-binding protein [Suillus clintonianus]KAG2129612.1 thiamine diphosphate-binding protein [Suillus clintonianus]